MSYAFISQSVGKNGKNIKEDVMSIQIRLNRWIMLGKLPDVPMLAVDGDCRSLSRKAIGAFQKLYLGMDYPDCRVDPGGKTLDMLFQSLISPQANAEAYQAWLKAQSAASQEEPSPAVKWNLSEESLANIRRNFGEEARDWARIPSNGTETREFFPYKLRDHYITLFGWKSPRPMATCVSKHDQIVQFLCMLRDDMGYWRQRANGNERIAIITQYAAACAVRDYRSLIIVRKMCPTDAYNMLVGIGKDVTYQMFLGMLRLLSPARLPNVPAESVTIAKIVNTLMKSLAEK